MAVAEGRKARRPSPTVSAEVKRLQAGRRLCGRRERLRCVDKVGCRRPSGVGAFSLGRPCTASGLKTNATLPAIRHSSTLLSPAFACLRPLALLPSVFGPARSEHGRGHACSCDDLAVALTAGCSRPRYDMQSGAAPPSISPSAVAVSAAARIDSCSRSGQRRKKCQRRLCPPTRDQARNAILSIPKKNIDLPAGGLLIMSSMRSTTMSHLGQIRDPCGWPPANRERLRKSQGRGTFGFSRTVLGARQGSDSYSMPNSNV